MRTAWIAVLAAVAAFAATASLQAAVKAVSTDGEATVYLIGSFSSDFDVSYGVTFSRAPANRSWSVVDITLLGRSGGSLAVGLSRVARNAGQLFGFTSSTQPGQVYAAFPVSCRSVCVIELRGHGGQIHAFVDHRLVRSWARTQIHMERPYVQINGEVDAAGDTIAALVRPIRVDADGHALRPPTCAFTTQGVHVSRTVGNGLRFAGSRDPKMAAGYLSLADGIMGNSCPRAGRTTKPRSHGDRL